MLPGDVAPWEATEGAEAKGDAKLVRVIAPEVEKS